MFMRKFLTLLVFTFIAFVFTNVQASQRHDFNVDPPGIVCDINTYDSYNFFAVPVVQTIEPGYQLINLYSQPFDDVCSLCADILYFVLDDRLCRNNMYREVEGPRKYLVSNYVQIIPYYNQNPVITHNYSCYGYSMWN